MLIKKTVTLTKDNLASKLVGMSNVKEGRRKPYYFFDVSSALQLMCLSSSNKTIYTNWFK